MISRFFILAAALNLSTAVLAQSSNTEHSSHRPVDATASVPASQPTTEGEVRKVDKLQGKVTLRHGRIENLDMAPMTMVFTAADSTLLERLNPGDKVRFSAEKRNGVFTVTGIELAN
ncbi:MAG: RND transporter [Betaproteobacteria bacterium]|jgi:Cu/Ag efflux protein CusF|nr:RND transporter [Betaproteobacteria bacterium]